MKAHTLLPVLRDLSLLNYKDWQKKKKREHLKCQCCLYQSSIFDTLAIMDSYMQLSPGGTSQHWRKLWICHIWKIQIRKIQFKSNSDNNGLQRFAPKGVQFFLLAWPLSKEIGSPSNHIHINDFSWLR